MKTLRAYADRVKQMVRQQSGTWDVHDSWGVPGFQLRVNVEEDKANLAGVTNDRIAQTLNAYFSGHHLTTFREGEHQVPVYLRLAAEERATLDGLETAFVRSFQQHWSVTQVYNLVVQSSFLLCILALCLLFSILLGNTRKVKKEKAKKKQK